MGSSAQGLARVALASAVALLWAFPLAAQVPAPPPGAKKPVAKAEEPPPAPPPPPPAAEPKPAPKREAPPAPPPPPPPAPPPPLNPPPAAEPATRPGFLHTREEMEHMNRAPSREQPPPIAPSPAPARAAQPEFLKRASPWIDFTLTSFYMDERVDNFLNIGMQAGAYLFEHLRVAGHLVVPLEEVNDSYNRYYDDYSSSGLVRREIDSRDVSVLYGLSVGLAITNSRSFVFGPGVTLLRTDVEAYGSAAFVTLPFEWTTQSNMRIGFEFGLGHAFDGKARVKGCTSSTSCTITTVDRPGGTSLLAQFYMGFALGKL